MIPALAETMTEHMARGPLKAPFPWFGGKSRAANLIWSRLGNVRNYVEPFAGSLAVLLGRPHEPNIETVNDKDCYVANFWRALKYDPEGLAEAADWPVNEADLTARHTWLVNQTEFREAMKTAPDYFDTKIAGWWVWGLSAWIGGGWCALRTRPVKRQRPHLGSGGMGVHRQLPHLGSGGRGVHRQLPHLGSGGMGVHRQLPHLGDGGRGVHRNATKDLKKYLIELSDRLRTVRVCCGDWSRVCSKAVTFGNGPTGVVLDPPYSDAADRAQRLYSADDLSVAHKVREWAIEHGDNPLLRIALCGYEGEHQMPAKWECVEWSAKCGYGGANGKENYKNAGRERIWFSPHCLQNLSLFTGESR
jgi:hypothetical protein